MATIHEEKGESNDKVGRSLKWLTAAAGIVVTVNTLVSGCIKEEIQRKSDYRAAIRQEQAYWAGLHDRYVAQLGEQLPPPVRQARLMGLASLAAQDIPQFDEYRSAIGWDDSHERAEAHLIRMRTDLHNVLRNDSFGGPEVAAIFDNKATIRDREAPAGDSGVPPAVTARASTATAETLNLQAQQAVEIGGASPALSYGTRILAVGPANGWDVDVFWCEGTGEADHYARALQAATLLADAARAGRRMNNEAEEHSVVIGRVRLRSLPTDQQAGLNGGNWVNWDRGPGEETAATALVRHWGRHKPPLLFRTVQSVGTPTRWYLSAFVCPATANAAQPRVAT